MIVFASSALFVIGISIILSIPSVLLGYFLKKEFQIPNRFWLSILITFGFNIYCEVYLHELSLFWRSLISIIGSTVGVYRLEFFNLRRIRKTRENDYPQIGEKAEIDKEGDSNIIDDDKSS